MSLPRKLPAIAPRPALARAQDDGRDDDTSDSNSTVSRDTFQLPPRRRKTKGGTCTPCRKHKIRCDGAKPCCSPCAKRARTCIYEQQTRDEEAVRQLEQSDRLLHLLLALPHDQATALLSSLRGDLAPTPGSARQLPPARAVLAKPLLSFLLRPNPPLLRVGMPASSFRSTPSAQSSTAATPGSDPLLASLGLGNPWLARRLSLLDISRWTTVDITSPMAIGAIALYLSNEYPILPLFDRQLFLDSLLSYQIYHCSALLVNALLGWACQAVSATSTADTKVPAPAALSSLLFREAERLWAAAAALATHEKNTLTSVAALQLMSMTATTRGDEDAAQRYAEAGCALGRLMGLFDVASAEGSAAAWAGRHDDWLRAASFTAWGTFNWTCVRSLHYHELDILTPPPLPMPWEGDCDVSIGDGDAEPSFDQSSVQAACQLFVIFHDMARRYFGRGGASVDHDGDEYDDDDGDATGASGRAGAIDIEFAETIYRRLLDWASGLPLGPVRGDNSGHHITMLQ
ncbi:hypothetical protein Micbo1qcDRAFT_197616 [Microdochium bolleyi]|uniref:Zn(2)-C6 fungal-type domain-containing protein n=1 Tax=Microdochium bolleyi TaxID=196109 RepID=A0A136ITD1_9PEZI|nr:hypothetical protein Micbo1qcDRAFT_197616 [Microdochium bolleyi]